jgi:hypothetical protein
MVGDALVLDNGSVTWNGETRSAPAVARRFRSLPATEPGSCQDGKNPRREFIRTTGTAALVLTAAELLRV